MIHGPGHRLLPTPASMSLGGLQKWDAGSVNAPGKDARPLCCQLRDFCGPWGEGGVGQVAQSAPNLHSPLLESLTCVFTHSCICSHLACFSSQPQALVILSSCVIYEMFTFWFRSCRYCFLYLYVFLLCLCVCHGQST